MRFAELDCLGALNIGSVPDRMVMVALEAVMLWPHDPEARALHQKYGIVRYSQEIWEDLSDDQKFIALSMAIDVPATDEMQVRTARRHVEGLVAAKKLAEPVARRVLGLEAASLSKIIDETCAGLAKFSREYRTAQVTPKTVNNHIWPRMKSTAPLWAAYVHEIATTGNTVWPCRPSDLWDFLSAAEAWRKAAEKTIPPHSKVPVLQKGDAVEIPGAERLPVTELEAI